MGVAKVFIDGSEGTTGLRLQQRLSGADGIELLAIDEQYRKDASARQELFHQADIAFLCLPDAAAREAAALAEGSSVRLIDASTAHRTAPGWAYGLAELSPAHRAAIAAGRRVAVPGCHASGFISLVYPLIAAGVIAADYPLSCLSLTGYSGGGKKMIADYEGESKPPGYASPRPYALGQQHKHLPEMQHICGLSRPPIFTPIVDDYYCGMWVGLPLFGSLLEQPLSVTELSEIYAAHYADAKLVCVVEADASGAAAANALAGRDGLEISVSGHGEQLLAAACFDNLGKGASGAAIQCMNIMLGREETAGLNI